MAAARKGLREDSLASWTVNSRSLLTRARVHGIDLAGLPGCSCRRNTHLKRSTTLQIHICSLCESLVASNPSSGPCHSGLPGIARAASCVNHALTLGQQNRKYQKIKGMHLWIFSMKCVGRKGPSAYTHCSSMVIRTNFKTSEGKNVTSIFVAQKECIQNTIMISILLL